MVPIAPTIWVVKVSTAAPAPTLGLDGMGPFHVTSLGLSGGGGSGELPSTSSGAEGSLLTMRFRRIMNPGSAHRKAPAGWAEMQAGSGTSWTVWGLQLSELGGVMQPGRGLVPEPSFSLDCWLTAYRRCWRLWGGWPQLSAMPGGLLAAVADELGTNQPRYLKGHHWPEMLSGVDPQLDGRLRPATCRRRWRDVALDGDSMMCWSEFMDKWLAYSKMSRLSVGLTHMGWRWSFWASLDARHDNSDVSWKI